MSGEPDPDALLEALTGHKPLRWQRRLLQAFRDGAWPDALALPTGLGKTSVIAIWLLARALNAKVPVRLVYVVDRRVVVDQASAVAEGLADVLDKPRDDADLQLLRRGLGLVCGQRLPISTLRGGKADSREWTYDPSLPAIIVGTVDMIGSRLLFEGYRMSRWSRPVQAGLLGADSLIVLDEAHLSPAFSGVIPRVIALQGAFTSAAPAVRFLPLSATTRSAPAAVIFRLQAEDEAEELVARRIGLCQPTKRLRFEPVGGTALVDTVVERAALHDGTRRAVIVYCDRRRDAKAIAQQLRQRLRRPEDIALVTGARRGFERDLMVQKPAWLAFTYDKDGKRLAPDDGHTRFLVCTSAGEVGADLDADAAVMDLVRLERMIQRLGRVNRRGLAGTAPVTVCLDPAALEPPPARKRDKKGNLEKKTDAFREAQARSIRLRATKRLLNRLPQLTASAFDASPVHLGALDAQRRAASTPPPALIPRIEAEHVEAWSLTSLRDHPGRPKVEPYLRGVTEGEEPATTVAWRADVSWLARLPDAAVSRAMEVARLLPAETLEAPSSEVAEMLFLRAANLAKVSENDAESDSVVRDPLRLLLLRGGKLLARGTVRPADERQDPQASGRRTRKGTVLLQSTVGGTEKSYDDAKLLAQQFAYATLLVDPRIGGLDGDGALADVAERPGQMHVRPSLKIQRTRAPDPDAEEVERIELIAEVRDPQSPRFRRAWSAALPAEGEDSPVWVLEYWKPWDPDGAAESAPKLQTLVEHQAWARDEMDALSRRLGLPPRLAEAMIRAIAMHDSGKARVGWQDGVGAPRDDGRPYAKSDKRGPGSAPYRHEFGSLRDALYKPAIATTLEGLDPDLRDLALHLIATHHGRARPSIPAHDEAEIFADALEQDALDVALRYVRMQQRWGPWGLAWLEAVFRSVDATVSRRLEAAAGDAT